MTKALVVHDYGGPEVLRLEEVEVGSPELGQIRMRHTAIGLNLSDTYRRRGVYPLKLPVIVGSEGAGVVTELGPGVEGLAVGERIAYAGPLGAYAEERLIAADKVVRLPEAIDDRQAAAMMLKGLTAACIGLLLACVRIEPFNGAERFIFGWYDLVEGLPVIAVIVGVFALPEIIDLSIRGRAVSSGRSSDISTAEVWRGALYGLKEWKVSIRVLSLIQEQQILL